MRGPARVVRLKPGGDVGFGEDREAVAGAGQAALLLG